METLADRRKLKSVGDYLVAFKDNLAHGHHGVYLVVGIAIGVAVVVATVMFCFPEDKRKEGRTVRKIASAITGFGLIFSFLGVADICWWLTAENLGAQPLLLDVESIKNTDDFWGFGHGALAAVALAVGTVMFFRLRLKILNWIPAFAAVVGLTLVVNFIATMLSI